MVRFGIIGIVVGVAFTLYALVDAAMSDGSRARGVSKPIWVVLIVVLPVIGGVLWFLIGKARGHAPSSSAPDDDPRFTGRSGSQREVDARLKDLEAQLKALDDEVYPGEVAPGDAAPGDGPRPTGPDAGPIDPNRDPNHS